MDFNTSKTGDWWNDVLNHYQELVGGQTPKYQTVYWTTDSNGTPYIYQTDTTLDYGSVANAVTMRTTQTLDTHGNLVSSSIYDYAAGNSPGTTLLRTYTNTYKTDSNYTSRYIFNRLQSSGVSSGGPTVTLVSNGYDESSLTDLTNPVPREHDAAYNTSFIYRGNVTSQTMPDKTVTRTFDIAGNVKTASDGNLSVAAATGGDSNYAAPSNLTPNNTSDLGSTYKDTGALDLKAVTMPNGASASATYASPGMPQTVYSATGARTDYVYSFSNTGLSTVTATTNGHWTRSTMDGLGRTIKVETGDASGTKSVTESEYTPCACSPNGKLWRVSQPHLPDPPPPQPPVTRLWTTYTYDARGRTLTITKPDNSLTTYAYAGNATTVIDAVGNASGVTSKAGHWKMFTTDALGNLKQVTEAGPTANPLPSLPPSNLADCETTTAGYLKTCYSYNLLNKLTQVKMPRNGMTQLRTFTYDKGGQGALLMSANNPENGTVSYLYNGDGTLAKRTDANNAVVLYSYDDYKRLTKVHRADNTEDNYFYDSYAGAQNAAGRLAAVTFQGRPDPNAGNTTFTNVYAYTAAGLVTAKRLLIARGIYGTSLEADYSYDDEGHVLSITYPTSQGSVNVNGVPTLVSQAGPTYSYTYDTMRRLNTMAQSGGPAYLGWGNQNLPVNLVQSVSYGVAGEILQIVGNANAGYGGETRGYNSLLQVTSIVEPAYGNGYPGTSITYTYPDGANIGKISKQKNMFSGEEVQYQYDSLGRMISAATTGPDWGYSYTYDGFGNLQSKNLTKGSGTAGWSAGVNPATNRAYGATYDGNGNTLTSTGGTSAEYDAENRMISYTNNGAEFYGYDPSNKRVQKQMADGTEEIHFYGASGERLGVYKLQYFNGSNLIYCQQATLNVYFGGKRIARVTNSGQTSFVQLDRVGSESTNLYPWGEEKTTTGQNIEKFATYYRDGTGLDYADQRYYSSIMGRFLTADLYTASGGLGNPQSWNRYSYALGDPINLYDPHGTQACPPDDPCPPPSPPPGWTPVQFPGQGGPNRPWQTQVPIDPPQLNDKQILSKAEQLAKKWLRNPDCAKLFGTGFDPVQVLSSLMTTGSFTSGNTQIRLFSFTFGTSALGGLTLPAASVSLFPPRIGLGADIFINTGVFSSVYPGDPSGAALETAETLIEELGHAYNYASGSGGSSIVYDNPLFAPSYQVGDNKVDAGTYNYTQIMKNCNK